MWRQTMRKTIKYIFLLSAVFLLSACSSPFRQVKPNEILECGAFSIVAPDTNWEISKKYSKEKYNQWKILPHIYHKTENIQFHIYTSDYRKGWQDEFFKKDGDYYDSDKREDVFTKNDKETGLTYKKGWITYVNHLKCAGGVFSRGFGGSYYSGGVKFYSITCGYYDTTETNNDGKRILNIDYRYTHNTKEPQEAKRKEKKIKDAVKKAISTLKIKNIDIPRMEEEGLMHNDKEFESTKW
jgi:hypothetical protein